MKIDRSPGGVNAAAEIQQVCEKNVLVYREYSDLQVWHADILRGVAARRSSNTIHEAYPYLLVHQNAPGLTGSTVTLCPPRYD